MLGKSQVDIEANEASELPAGYEVERVDLLGGEFVCWSLLLNGVMISSHLSPDAAKEAAVEHSRSMH